MKVYILETGCYENRGVQGVFATPEAAMSAHKTRANQEWKYEEEWGWSNDMDWDDAADVFEAEVEGFGSTTPDSAGQTGASVANEGGGFGSGSADEADS